MESESWAEGSVVRGKYRILKRLAQSAVCTVYQALQLDSSEVRALKVMNGSLAGDAALVRLFKQEATQRKKLRHPNVARVAGIDTSDDGLLFTVMEYVEGRNLHEVIRQEAPLAPLRACAIVRQVAAALEAAHALRILQRDVKPQSVVLAYGPGGEQAKLLGFMDAKFKEAIMQDRFRSSPEAVIGTLQYLPPEQALGMSGNELDGRADLYSLGVIMYEMLTGELPFRADTAADWMTSHILGTPIPIRVAYSHLAIPDVLTTLVMRCLEKNREFRPASARQFVHELGWVEEEIHRQERARRSARNPAPRTFSGWRFWKS